MAHYDCRHCGDYMCMGECSVKKVDQKPIGTPVFSWAQALEELFEFVDSFRDSSRVHGLRSMATGLELIAALARSKAAALEGIRPTKPPLGDL